MNFKDISNWNVQYNYEQYFSHEENEKINNIFSSMKNIINYAISLEDYYLSLPKFEEDLLYTKTGSPYFGFNNNFDNKIESIYNSLVNDLREHNRQLIQLIDRKFNVYIKMPLIASYNVKKGFRCSLTEFTLQEYINFIKPNEKLFEDFIIENNKKAWKYLFSNINVKSGLIVNSFKNNNLILTNYQYSENNLYLFNKLLNYYIHDDITSDVNYLNTENWYSNNTINQKGIKTIKFYKNNNIKITFETENDLNIFYNKFIFGQAASIY